ncbi:nicotinate phosphoribosyltransferase [Fulvivirga sediminis]|uniref:Nicotinate phosphoribosyltransferase n=1 Tax=Fulvivirga sediminis TaxID=2803949 RepID=A0A937F8Y1_9BACT|nr:nicotinate phosphoribosyltransferase [Fulvivirga sediminis]MBL3656445.1 nicotinate phosphoribosyltransferase [Fulvivirga sediminis]
MILTNLTATYTDLYQISMGQVYFLKGAVNDKVVFDYFFRRIPYKGGYAVYAGLQDVLEILQNLSFSADDLEYLKSQGFNKEYVDALKDFKFRGCIYSAPEGDLIFPNRPILRVEATMLEAQLIETVLLNIINFQSLIATKAARVKQVAKDKILSDFGLRRSHALGGLSASRATIIGGFNSTSNVLAGKDYNIPVSGTMAHSFIQSYEDELTAFRDFAEARPNACILLVDTYDTLKSGVPNAITVGKEMEAKGNKLSAIRLDSGDLAYLAKKARKMLDDAGLSYVKIAASNQLDEYVIKSLMDQKAPIDIFGVGTNLVTGQPDAAFDGVYKLCLSNDQPRIKLSENLSKTTLPDRKQVWRLYDEDGFLFGADAIALHDEVDIDIMHHAYEPHKQLDIRNITKKPILKKVFENGEILTGSPSLSDISKFSQEQLSLLPDEYKRFEYPHNYKIGISSKLKALRNDLREKYKVKKG